MAEIEDQNVWRFEDHRDFKKIEQKLQIAGIRYSRHSTTVSYFLRQGASIWLESYELHASYTGQTLASGEPEVAKVYLKNSYGVGASSENDSWVADSLGEEISEADFYSMILYAQPDRVLSLQQIGFETPTGHYLVEFNLESNLLVLICLKDADRVPSMMASMVLPQPLSRSNYLIELLQSNGGLLSP